MSGGHLCRRQKHRPSRQARRGINASKIDFRDLGAGGVEIEGETYYNGDR